MRALLMLGFLLFPVTPADATTFAPRPFEQVVGEAPVIVRGEVALVRSDWAQGEDGARRIYTFIDLRVGEWLKGRPAEISGNRLTVREIGGIVGDVGMEVAGSAKFRTGEDVVLMVMDRRHADGSYDLRGLMMSKLGVQRDSKGAEILVGPAISMGRNAPGDDHNGTDEPRRSWSIDDFKELLAAQERSAQVGGTAGESSSPKGDQSGRGAGATAGAPPLQPAMSESGVGPGGAISQQDASAKSESGATEDPLGASADVSVSRIAIAFALGVAILIASLVAWIRHRSTPRKRSH